MNKRSYNRRAWLNPPQSHFTGTVVCHDGVVSNQGRAPERYSFVEISSCHGKVKLHADKNDGEDQDFQFLKKIDLLILELTDFRDHLEGNLPDNSGPGGDDD